MNDVIERFSSIDALLKALDSRPVNSVFSGRFLSSERRDGYGMSFTGVRSYQEAENLFRHGYTEVLLELKKAAAPTPTRPRRTPGTAPAGYAPHVPNSIQGLPNSMIFAKITPQKTRNIEIVYNISVGCNTSTRSMIKAGKRLLAAINHIEKSGIRVKLSILLIAVVNEKKLSASSQLATVLVELKQYTENINYKKLCFPMIHPAALRRIGFKWLETTPEKISKKFVSVHGYSAPEFLTKHKLGKKTKLIMARNIIDHNQTPEEIEKDICCL